MKKDKRSKELDVPSRVSIMKLDIDIATGWRREDGSYTNTGIFAAGMREAFKAGTCDFYGPPIASMITTTDPPNSTNSNTPIQMPDDNVYRLSFYEHPKGNTRVNVMHFGLSEVDDNLEGDYDSVEMLPDWIKQRVAVLMLTSAVPPTREVIGVGRRISENVFWVHVQNGE